MGGRDRTKRALFTVVCLLVIMLCVASVVVKNSALKLQSGWVGGRAGLKQLLSAGIRSSTLLLRRLVFLGSGVAVASGSLSGSENDRFRKASLPPFRKKNPSTDAVATAVQSSDGTYSELAD
jgi:hypothetical protein